MSICHLITILSFVLMIQTSHPFKPPKHNIISYYKTVNNVFLTNPENHTTGYGIYVAGETTTVDVPSSVANVYDIVNWKVINVDKDRLMFVHNNRPQILVDQKRIREMEYLGKLSDSIISLGDNVALHVPTISDDLLTQPPPKWNYIELLHFDSKNESVTLIRSLPWFDDDDWKYIIEWKMMDYIHFDNKLYLLILRSIWNVKVSNVNQEVSIMRLCLDKGSDLFFSAIEIHFTRPEFHNSQIIQAIFSSRRELHNAIYHRRMESNFDLNYKYDLFITLNTSNQDQIYSDVYEYIFHDKDMFDIVDGMCASGAKSSELNLLKYHLRSESSECKQSVYEPRSLSKNFIPSFDSSNRLQISRVDGIKSERIHRNASYSVKYQSITFAHPFEEWYFFRINNQLSKSVLSNNGYCVHGVDHCQPIDERLSKRKSLDKDVEQQVFVNQRPFGGFFITKKSHEIIFFNFNFICRELTNCIDCIMFGLYFNCVWSHETPTLLKCIYDDQPKHKTALTVNFCFKIIYFSPSVFYVSLQRTLSIQLNTPMTINNSEESLVIHAGPDNYCTNITMKQLYIQCSMNPLKSGNFNIEINLMNDKFADVTMISAVSTEMVHIIAPKNESDNSSTIIPLTSSIIIVLFFLCLYALIACKRCETLKIYKVVWINAKNEIQVSL